MVTLLALEFVLIYTMTTVHVVAVSHAELATMRARRAELLQRYAEEKARSKDLGNPLETILAHLDERIIDARIAIAAHEAGKHYAPSLVTECGACADLENSVDKVRSSIQNYATCRQDMIGSLQIAIEAIIRERASVDKEKAQSNDERVRVTKSLFLKVSQANEEIVNELNAFRQWQHSFQLKQSEILNELVSVQSALSTTVEEAIPGFDNEALKWQDRIEQVNELIDRTQQELNLLSDIQEDLSSSSIANEQAVCSLQEARDRLQQKSN